MKIGLCVPTLHAEADFARFLPAIAGIRVDRKLVIDSSSSDRTVGLASGAGFEVEVIPRADFDHGGTRQLGVELLHDCDIIIFLTQDAILNGTESIDRLVDAFRDPSVGAAYGRQLPRPEASPLEAHGRLFGYPGHSQVKSWPESRSLGIMAGAVSNSFAAYRRSALLEQGGFPSGTVCSEDVYVGFKMLFGGWKIAYVAESTVFHSHDYTPVQEFRRYFDIGAFYGAYEPWIIRAIGRAERRGIRMLASQLKFIAFRSPLRLPLLPISAAAKYIGYRVGAKCESLPPWLCVCLGMNKAFWQRRSKARSQQRVLGIV